MGTIHTEFIVLDPEEIPEIEKPPFGNGRYRKEEEYLDYLLEGQIYFEEYAETGRIAQIEKLIGKPNAGLSEQNEWLLNFEHNFLGPDCITVEIQDGTYVLSSNGRHRMYVAKRNGLPSQQCHACDRA